MGETPVKPPHRSHQNQKVAKRGTESPALGTTEDRDDPAAAPRLPLVKAEGKTPDPIPVAKERVPRVDDGAHKTQEPQTIRQHPAG